MKQTVVINVVGLTEEMIGKHTPFLAKWSEQAKITYIKPALPAVTCTAQSCYLTGKWPSEHGVVGNGWYFKDECEVKFWRQSNKLVQTSKIWETAKRLDPSFTCTNMFWWYNMYSSVEVSVTPRPIYTADGSKFSDCYTYPADLRHQLQSKLGLFPLFDFWGPKTSIRSSRWIADAAMNSTLSYPTTLTLIYLPHLDYNLQRLGPHHPSIATDLKEIDEVCADLINFYEQREMQVVVLSEYGITEVNQGIDLNRVLRQQNYIKVREERGFELLDPGASVAFAVADHQLAHIYVNDKNKLSKVRALIEKIPGVEHVYGEEEKTLHHLNHARAGDLVTIANPNAWFTYYYWLDDAKAPDYARTVDIHRKPGYDPVELFVDPDIRFLKFKVMTKLLKKKAGFRYLLDVIPLSASLVKGSHGRYPTNLHQAPLLISKQKQLIPSSQLQAIDVHDLLLAHLQNGC